MAKDCYFTGSSGLPHSGQNWNVTFEITVPHDPHVRLPASVFVRG